MNRIYLRIVDISLSGVTGRIPPSSEPCTRQAPSYQAQRPRCLLVLRAYLGKQTRRTETSLAAGRLVRARAGVCRRVATSSCHPFMRGFQGAGGRNPRSPARRNACHDLVNIRPAADVGALCESKGNVYHSPVSKGKDVDSSHSSPEMSSETVKLTASS